MTKFRAFGFAAVIGAASGAATSAWAVTIFGLSTRNQLVRFDSATPGSLSASNFISGLGPSEQVIGIDFRPATRQLYALGSLNRIYTLNTATAAATQVGSGFSPLLNGVEFGFDFNPVVDRIRVTSDLDQNLRLHPATGAGVATDGSLAYVAGDPNFGRNPNVVGSAYTNNFAGTGSTTLYNIDSELDILVTQVPPNAGGLNTVGSLGFDTGGLVGFDVMLGTNTRAFASLTSPGGAFSRLFTVNLATGAASHVGIIGVGDGTLVLRDITVVPEPATVVAFGLGALAMLRRRRTNF